MAAFLLLAAALVTLLSGQWTCLVGHYPKDQLGPSGQRMMSVSSHRTLQGFSSQTSFLPVTHIHTTTRPNHSHASQPSQTRYTHTLWLASLSLTWSHKHNHTHHHHHLRRSLRVEYDGPSGGSLLWVFKWLRRPILEPQTFLQWGH